MHGLQIVGHIVYSFWSDFGWCTCRGMIHSYNSSTEETSYLIAVQDDGEQEEVDFGRAIHNFTLLNWQLGTVIAAAHQRKNWSFSQDPAARGAACTATGRRLGINGMTHCRPKACYDT